LSEFSRKGYVLDKNRLINDQVFSMQYFDELIAEIQEIRASERKFYQKITDIYATSVDYDANSKTSCILPSIGISLYLRGEIGAPRRQLRILARDIIPMMSTHCF
jgi:hypothetical protein